MCRTNLRGGYSAVTFVLPSTASAGYVMVTEFNNRHGITVSYVEEPLAQSVRSTASIDKAELEEFHKKNVDTYKEEA